MSTNQVSKNSPHDLLRFAYGDDRRAVTMRTTFATDELAWQAMKDILGMGPRHKADVSEKHTYCIVPAGCKLAPIGKFAVKR
jgi:hypothetical protein